MSIFCYQKVLKMANMLFCATDYCFKRCRFSGAVTRNMFDSINVVTLR